MPLGKPAFVRCVHLTPDARCAIFGRSDRPRVCESLVPSREMCGDSADEAMTNLIELERLTKPRP